MSKDYFNYIFNYTGFQAVFGETYLSRYKANDITAGKQCKGTAFFVFKYEKDSNTIMRSSGVS
ncbi:MAG: hypothetical protein LBU35_03620 [Holosporales bacterium]|jgi:hypothetical protein|nr:hypothetical protein [Holosporales bacterium]